MRKPWLQAAIAALTLACIVCTWAIQTEKVEIGVDGQYDDTVAIERDASGQLTLRDQATAAVALADLAQRPLASLEDVSSGTPQTGDLLMFDGALGLWVSASQLLAPLTRLEFDGGEGSDYLIEAAPSQLTINPSSAGAGTVQLGGAGQNDLTLVEGALRCTGDIITSTAGKRISAYGSADGSKHASIEHTGSYSIIRLSGGMTYLRNYNGDIRLYPGNDAYRLVGVSASDAERWSLSPSGDCWLTGSIATGGNELLARDIIRHTMTAGEASAHAFSEAWNKAGTKKIAEIHVGWVEEADASDTWRSGTHSAFAVAYDGAAIAVNDVDAQLVEGDVVTLAIGWQK